jgi:hypothetical protein
MIFGQRVYQGVFYCSPGACPYISHLQDLSLVNRRMEEVAIGQFEEHTVLKIQPDDSQYEGTSSVTWDQLASRLLADHYQEGTS